MMLWWLLPLLGGLLVFGAMGKGTEALSISFNDQAGLWTCSKKIIGLDLKISTHYNPIYET